MRRTDLDAPRARLTRHLMRSRSIGLLPAAVAVALDLVLRGRLEGAAGLVLLTAGGATLAFAVWLSGLWLSGPMERLLAARDPAAMPDGARRAGRATGAEGAGWDERRARLAGREVATLPGHVQRSVLATAPIVVLGPLLLLRAGFGDEILSLPRLLDFGLTGLAGAGLGSILARLHARRGVAMLGSDPARPSDGAGAPRSVPGAFAPWLGLAVVGPAAVMALLLVQSVQDGLREASSARAIEWTQKALDAVALADAADPLEQRVAERLPDRALWPVRLDFAELHAGRGSLQVVQPFDSAPTRSGRFAERLARADRAGRSSLRLPGETVVFRRLDDATLLIARVPDAGLAGAGPSGRLLGRIAACLGLVLLAAGWIARSAGRGLDDVLDVVRRRVDRLAAGDPQSPGSWAPAPELAELVGALEALERRLHDRLTRSAAAERAAGCGRAQLEDVIARAVPLQAGRRQRLDTVREALASLARDLESGTQSIAGLADGLEASSTAALELGTGGQEIEEAAGVLAAQVEAVSAALEESLRGVTRLGSTTDRLVSASEDTSSSMEEMASAMRAVDSAAEAMAHLSGDVIEKAELGRETVARTIAGMEAIRVATEAAERVIRGLGARTREIGGILDVIDDVADETNLLALNAAIIAAQAGEQGRAFSVVAEEIKELADRVLASTKEIGGLIRAVQDESENAIGAIAAGAESVQSGVALSAESGRTLEQITEASRESGLRIESIVASVREQTGAAGHVVALMERVREAAEEIAAVGVEHDRGNERVVQSIATMRESALEVGHAAQRQARGYERMRQEVADLRGTLLRVVAGLREQATPRSEALRALEEAIEDDRLARALVEEMAAIAARLPAQAADAGEEAARPRA